MTRSSSPNPAPPSTALERRQALKDELAARLAADLALLEKVQLETQAGATDEEAKPENDKDTRALEQTYLARGQAQRVEELRGAVADVRNLALRELTADAPVCLGALVTIEEDGRRQKLFLAQHGGGTLLEGGTVQVVTPRSPLGEALIGARAGEDLDIEVGGRTREITVVAVE